MFCILLIRGENLKGFILQETSFRLVGKTCKDPPQAHGCCMEDIHFWDLELVDEYQGIKTIPRVQQTPGDCIILSTDWSQHIPFRNETNVHFHFEASQLYFEGEAVPFVLKYFKTQPKPQDIICFGHVDINITGDDSE